MGIWVSVMKKISAYADADANIIFITKVGMYTNAGVRNPKQPHTVINESGVNKYSLSSSSSIHVCGKHKPSAFLFNILSYLHSRAISEKSGKSKGSANRPP